MDEPTLWWLAAGLAVIAELLTGTFYLLMVALGLAAGALAAHAGASSIVQVLCAAAAGGTAVLLCWARRRQQPAPPPTSANPDVNLDIGQPVQVLQWQPDGTAQVHYRGAQWRVRLQQPDATPAPGTYVIRAVEGSELILGH